MRSLQVRIAVGVAGAAAAAALYYAVDCDSGPAVIVDPSNDDSG